VSPAALQLRQHVTLGQMVGSPAVDLLLSGPAAIAPAGQGTGPSALSLAPSGASGSGGAVRQAAERYLGVPYLWGGTNPATGLDCSGFTQRVFADLGVTIPRVSIDQSKAGTAVASLAEAQPGDLVFRRGSPNHIGIYLGDGQFIHAPRSGDVVKIAKLTWTPDAIRRVI
jgi:peptidoglycan DL-endopeptidase CwlO